MAMLPLFSGCGTIHYLYQAGRGQLALSNRSRPIAEVVADARTPDRIRALLERVGDIKAYGEKYGLKPTSNYQDYVALDRPAVVWVVSACRPLQFESRTWGFPLVGSFTYLGWFEKADALTHADQLKAEGWDVDVRGARAYSTLGWFRDPILSTMIPAGPEATGDLVNTVIHESVHATLYVPGQSTFNESLASFMADRLAPVYLRERLGEKAAELTAYVEYEKKGDDSREKMHAAYSALQALYASSVSDEDKRAQKKKILDDLKAAIKSPRDLTNASLIQYRTYGTGTESFGALFERCGSDWRKFLAILKSAEFPKTQTEDIDPVIRALAGKC